MTNEDRGGAAADVPLVARELVKTFRDFWGRPRVQALRGISFDVHRGEVFGLLGPNGSGKSTTMKLILGLLHPTSGFVEVLGCSPRDVRAKARVGFLPEESALYPYLTARETLDFCGRLFDIGDAERRRRVEQLLEMVGLGHAADRRVGEFSKGMSRRVGLAQALINNPDLVLLDEPTSGLDPVGSRHVKDLIRALADAGKTVVLSSHLLADVEDVCDRIAILYNGVVRAEGPVASLLQAPGAVRVLFPGLPPEALGPVLARLRAETGCDVLCEHPRRDLEEVFLDVVRRAHGAGDASASGVAAATGTAPFLFQDSARGGG